MGIRMYFKVVKQLPLHIILLCVAHDELVSQICTPYFFEVFETPGLESPFSAFELELINQLGIMQVAIDDGGVKNIYTFNTKGLLTQHSISPVWINDSCSYETDYYYDEKNRFILEETTTNSPIQGFTYHLDSLLYDDKNRINRIYNYMIPSTDESSQNEKTILEDFHLESADDDGVVLIDTTFEFGPIRHRYNNQNELQSVHMVHRTDSLVIEEKRDEY